MTRVLSSVHLDEDQLRGLRQIVLELKDTVPLATQSSVIRFAVDLVISDWKNPRRRKEITEAVKKQQERQ